MMSATHGAYSTTQKGIGLVEVLVALLLLAVAALGYSALQARALGTTDEAIVRTQALVLLRDAAERIRTNHPSKTTLNSYQAALSATCTATPCSAEEAVKNDVDDLTRQATQIGVTLGMSDCPGTSSKCLIAAWNDTKAETGTAAPACMNSSSGTYFFNADCVYMEAY